MILSELMGIGGLHYFFMSLRGFALVAGLEETVWLKDQIGLVSNGWLTFPDWIHGFGVECIPLAKGAWIEKSIRK